MSNTIKNLSITYDAINEENTFSSGDFILGRLRLEVAKEAEIDSLLIKAKGKASVMWTEQYGKVTVVYYEKEKYFTLEQYIIQERKGQGQDYQTLLTGSGETYSNVVLPGVHEYPFTFQIPQGNMPSSFKGVCGKIIYTLEAKLSRSMRVPSKAKTEFTYLSKANVDIPQLMKPQFGTREEKMRFFTSGNVSMNINIEKMGFMQGEGLKVNVEVVNGSSRKIVPKFCFYQKQSFFANGKRRVHTSKILKEKGEPVPSSTNQKITKVLNIPSTVSTTILNCKVLHVEYRLKVYLDIPYAKDPEIKLPVIILPVLCPFGEVEKMNPPPWGI